MLPAAWWLALSLTHPAASESMLRQIIGETSLRQVRVMDPRWQPSQRDCAGLVRFAYRTALTQLEPERATSGLWHGAHGELLDFADAETLLAHNFTLLGRGLDAEREARTGDLLAFRQARGDDAEAAYHLMLLVRPQDTLDDAWVVYHPGAVNQAVRAGKLRAYVREAPREWQPQTANPAFLGYYRFKEWCDDTSRRP